MPPAAYQQVRGLGGDVRHGSLPVEPLHRHQPDLLPPPAALGG